MRIVKKRKRRKRNEKCKKRLKRNYGMNVTPIALHEFCKFYIKLVKLFDFNESYHPTCKKWLRFSAKVLAKSDSNFVAKVKMPSPGWG
jgi:hypothetical protein